MRAYPGRWPLLATLALAAALAPSLALAHGSMKPRHGGTVSEAGETVVELVREADGIALYLSDEDEPVPSAGMAGTLTVKGPGAPVEVALAPGAANRLEAKGAKVPAGAEVTVMLLDQATRAKSFTTFAVK